MNESGSNPLTAGKITGCYGIKGWVKVHSFTDPAENLFRFGKWMLQRRGALVAVEFDHWKPQGKGMVAHIAGVDDRDLAESYKGLQIVVEADSLPPLEEGEFYWRQLQGLQAWGREPGSSDDRVLLGTVDYLIETGANDVLVVIGKDGKGTPVECLVPWIEQVIVEVNLDQRRLLIDWDADF